MPNVILPNSIFLHVMKTGGQWVWKTLCKTKLGRNAGLPHTSLSELRDAKYYRPGAFVFGFVRHPLEWYKSFYRFSVGRKRNQSGIRRWENRDNYDRISHPHPGVSFAEFCEYILERHPGYCTKNYWDSVGPPDDEIEFIGRTEQLRSDLIKALRLAGELVSARQKQSILMSRKVNVSPKVNAEYPVKLLGEFVRNERESLERFGYSKWLE